MFVIRASREVELPKQVLDPKEILELLGDPREVARDLQAFAKSERAFAASYSRLIEKHPREWVAFFNGRLAAHGPTLESLIALMDEQHIPRGRAFIQFLDPNPPLRILSANAEG